MEHLAGFAPLAARYDGFILDLWGVIHDGVRAFPQAIECLRRLRAADKRTLLLSNAPRPNAAVQIMLRDMGVGDDLYGALLTSGEAVRQAVRHPPDAWWAALGRRVYHLGAPRDRPILDGLGLVLASHPEQADFVLNTGPDDLAEPPPTDLIAFEPLLRACAACQLPMVCANPDLEVARGHARVLCAGALAARYAELGGDVRSLGKPDPRIYRPVLDRLGLPPARVLAVGDALRTDIAGAAGAGIAACWVLAGLHGAELAGEDGVPDPMRAATEAAAAGLMPVASVLRFAWESA